MVKFNPPWKGPPISFKTQGEWRYVQEHNVEDYLGVTQEAYSFFDDGEAGIRVIKITPALIAHLKSEGMGYNTTDLNQLGFTSGYLIILDQIGSDGSTIIKLSSATTLEGAVTKVLTQILSRFSSVEEAGKGLGGDWRDPTEKPWY